MRPLYPWDGHSARRNPPGMRTRTEKRSEAAVQTSSKFVGRLGSIAAVLGGVLWSAKAFYDRNDAPPWPTDITDTLFFVIPLLFLVGLVGLYARCRGRLGEWEALSSVAFGVGFVGLAWSLAGFFAAMLQAGPAWWIEISWWRILLGFFFMHLGLLFLGNSVLQSGALPRWRGLPVVIGALGILLILVGDPSYSPLGVYPTLVFWVLYGLLWAALGYVLLADRGEEKDDPTTAGDAMRSTP